MAGFVWKVSKPVFTVCVLTLSEVPSLLAWWAISLKYSETSLKRPIVGPTLSGPFREVVGLGRLNIVIMVLYGHRLGPILIYRYRGVVDLWRWSG